MRSLALALALAAAGPTPLASERAARQQADDQIKRALVGSSAALADRDAAVVGELRAVKERQQGSLTQLSVALASEIGSRQKNDQVLVGAMSKLRADNEAKISSALGSFKSMRSRIVQAAIAKLDSKNQDALKNALAKVDAKREAALQRSLAELNIKREKVLFKSLQNLTREFNSGLAKLDAKQKRIVALEEKARDGADVALNSVADRQSAAINQALAVEIRRRQAGDLEASTDRDRAVTTLRTRIGTAMKQDVAALATQRSKATQEAAIALDQRDQQQVSVAMQTVSNATDRVMAAMRSKHERVLAAEAAERKAGDLQEQNLVMSKLLEVNKAMKDETEHRKTGDKAQDEAEHLALADMSKKVKSSYSGELKKLAGAADGQLDLEAKKRRADDKALSSKLDAVVSEDEATLASEVSARKRGNTAAQAALDGTETKLVNAVEKLDSKRAATLGSTVGQLKRSDKKIQDGIATLGSMAVSQLTTEATARKGADQDEATARGQADAALTRRIGSVETMVTKKVEQESSLQTEADRKVLQEAESRDEEIRSVLAKEVTARRAEDQAITKTRESEVDQAKTTAAASVRANLAKFDKQREKRLKVMLANLDLQRQKKLDLALKAARNEHTAKFAKVVKKQERKTLKGLGTETRARQTEDQKNNAAIKRDTMKMASVVGAEASARQAGDDAEAQARRTDVLKLRSAIQTHKDLAGKSLAKETKERKAGDEKFRAEVDKTTQNLLGAVRSEQGAREKGDAAERKAVEADVKAAEKKVTGSLKSGIKTLDSSATKDLDTEITKMTKARDATRKSAVADALAEGKTRAKKAAAVLGGKVDKAVEAEITARKAADKKIGEQVVEAEAQVAQEQTKSSEAEATALDKEQAERKKQDADQKAAIDAVESKHHKEMGKEEEAREAGDRKIDLAMKDGDRQLNAKIKEELKSRQRGDRAVNRTIASQKWELQTKLRKQDAAYKAAETKEGDTRAKEDRKTLEMLDQKVRHLRALLKAEERARIRGDLQKKSLLQQLEGEAKRRNRALTSAESDLAQGAQSLEAERDEISNLRGTLHHAAASIPSATQRWLRAQPSVSLAEELGEMLVPHAPRAAELAQELTRELKMRPGHRTAKMAALIHEIRVQLRDAKASL
mmetsp:Transcript_1878/g.4336  ORF Transcript_1878/g.4336 Transcript_1878/m.4336 type:complete len:1139 (+) Transcript_1878:161-3577(+)